MGEEVVWSVCVLGKITCVHTQRRTKLRGLDNCRAVQELLYFHYGSTLALYARYFCNI